MKKVLATMAVLVLGGAARAADKVYIHPKEMPKQTMNGIDAIRSVLKGEATVLYECRSVVLHQNGKFKKAD